MQRTLPSDAECLTPVLFQAIATLPSHIARKHFTHAA
jgi:hypothetical protein